MAMKVNVPVLGGLGHEICKVAQRNVTSSSSWRRGRNPARSHHFRDAPMVSKISSTRLRAVAEQATNSSKPDQRGIHVEVDNVADDTSTVISITGLNRPGLLAELTQTIQKLQLEVVKVHNLSNA